MHAFAVLYKAHSGRTLVETAHMELAEPSIATAFDICVARGARTVVISPYFLSPGRHWHTQIVEDRLNHCLEHVAGRAPECDVCEGTGRCALRSAYDDNDEERTEHASISQASVQ
eukprot:jgi/Chlat1/1072/Chrsp110S08637